MSCFSLCGVDWTTNDLTLKLPSVSTSLLNFLLQHKAHIQYSIVAGLHICIYRTSCTVVPITYVVATV